MKTTYEDLFEYHRISQEWLKLESNTDTKLGYAIKRTQKRVEKAIRKHQRLERDINADNCATDEKGIILTDPTGGFKFTPAGLKAVNIAVEQLADKEVEIEPYYATAIPDGLPELEREVFRGFVLKEEATGATGD